MVCSAGQAGIDSAFFIAQEQVSGVTRIRFTFDGSPDRLPFAPYSLVTFSVDGSLHEFGIRSVEAVLEGSA